MLYYLLMHYIFYPKTTIHKNKSELKNGESYIEYKDEGGYVGNEISDLLKKNKTRWVYLRVVDLLDKLALEENEGLKHYFSNEILKNIRNGITEIRVPKQDKKGVFRIYYCSSELQCEKGASILLESEYKEGDAKKIQTAIDRRTEYKATVERRKKHEKH